MTIKKYQGKTKEEAIDAAKAELGPRVVIMNVKEVHPKGFLGSFKKATFEVTAAVEDEFVPAGMPEKSPVSAETAHPGEAAAPRMPEIPPQYEYTPIGAEPAVPAGETYSRGKKGKRQGFDAVVDDNLGNTLHPQKKNSVSEDDLKSAFREVSQVIQGAEHISVSDVKGFDSEKPVIKKTEAPGAGRTTAHGMTGIEAAGRKNSAAAAASASLQGTPAAGARRAEKTTADMHEDAKKAVASRPADSVPAPKAADTGAIPAANAGFVRMIYNILMDHEVDERYVNRIINDMGPIMTRENSLDYLISSVYQKMVLLLGPPNPVTIPEKRPKVCFFIGPTGVGKTTTIAKIASEFKVEKRNSVALLTADTYRIAATKQLKVYADILSIPINVVYAPEDIGEEIEKVSDADLILVDTVGFSHKNEDQRENLKRMLSSVPEGVDTENYLVLSATTKYPDLKEIIDAYSDFCDYTLIFTKLDETEMYGNILNARLYSGRSLSYVTTGQDVPDDIEEIDMQKLTKLLLGGSADGSGRTPQKRS